MGLPVFLQMFCYYQCSVILPDGALGCLQSVIVVFPDPTHLIFGNGTHLIFSALVTVLINS